MIKLLKKEINFYEKNGWVKTSLNLSENQLKTYQNSVNELINKAIKNKHKYRRIYFDYLFKFNIAAIELPLHKSICNKGVYDLFKKIKLGRNVNKLLKSKKCICLLNRLFTMKNYNYSGHMHQDHQLKKKRVQVMIYLNDEDGFRIFKKKYEHKIKQIFFSKKLESSTNFYLPIKFEEKYLHTINAKAGEILFFDPAIPHQGIYKNNRMVFHLRFDEFKEHLHKKFYLDKNLDFINRKEYDPNLDLDKSNIDFPKANRSKFFIRILNTINYFFPILNLIRLFKLRRNFQFNKNKFDVFSNTFYQKKI